MCWTHKRRRVTISLLHEEMNIFDAHCFSLFSSFLLPWVNGGKVPSFTLSVLSSGYHRGVADLPSVYWDYCGCLTSLNIEAWQQCPSNQHKWNLVFERRKVYTTSWLECEQTLDYMCGVNIWQDKRGVKDTLGPFSTHSVNSAATYSSPSWAQTFPICPLYGFSGEDVGRSAASSQVSTNCTLTAGCVDL